MAKLYWHLGLLQHLESQPVLCQEWLPDLSRALGEIPSDKRQRKLGGAEDDPSVRVTRGLLDIARSVETLAPLPRIAEKLQGDHGMAQEQLRASLEASTAALDALRDSTQALNTHSKSAQDQRMVDALLSLSITYRKLIMPLVRAVETRLGLDSDHPDIADVESKLDALGETPPARKKGQSQGRGQP